MPEDELEDDDAIPGMLDDEEDEDDDAPLIPGEEEDEDEEKQMADHGFHEEEDLPPAPAF